MKEAHVGYSPFARHLRRDGTPNGSCAYPRISKCGCLDRQKSEVGLMKLSACRWHACCHHPCGNLGVPPATKAAIKGLHASAAKATAGTSPGIDDFEVA